MKQFCTVSLLLASLLSMFMETAGAQNNPVTNPVQIGLIPYLYSPSTTSLGGDPEWRFLIYASLAGSTTPQLYTFDTGGEGFNAAYATNPGYSPAWGTNFTLINPTNSSMTYGYGSNAQYTYGGTVSTSFTLYTSNNSGLSTAITSSNIVVAQMTNMTQGGVTLWPSTNPPWNGVAYGDFGLHLSWQDNGVVNPLAQLVYATNVIAGYMVHLGFQDSSSVTPPPGAYVQIGLTASNLATFPDRFPLLTTPPTNTFANSGLPTYSAASFISSMTLSNPALGVTNVNIQVILDSGATPLLKYTSNYSSLAAFFSVTNGPGTISLVVTNTLLSILNCKAAQALLFN